MKAQITTGLLALVLAGCSQPMETPTPSSAMAPAPVPAIPHTAVDPVAAPRHPEAVNRAERAFEQAEFQRFGPSLSNFAERYEAAGSPRVAILFNRRFSSQLTSWAMDSKEVSQSLRASAGSGSAAANFNSAAVAGQDVEVNRSESFHEFANVEARQGFSSEYVEWKFREGFTAPFFSVGVQLVDSDLVVQTASRTDEHDGWDESDIESQRISDINMNLAALKEKTDWIIEVLMVPDSRTAAGYLFRADVKDLESSTVLASVITEPEDFLDRPVRRKIIAAPGGYRIEEEELPAPTLEEYAEDLSIRLLSELNQRLAAKQ